jgi:hypothetical protein
MADADFAAVEPRPDPLRPSHPSVFACTVPTTRPICSATATTRCSTASLEVRDDRGFAGFASEPFGLLLVVVLLLRFAMRALLAHCVPSDAMAQALLTSGRAERSIAHRFRGVSDSVNRPDRVAAALAPRAAARLPDAKERECVEFRSRVRRGRPRCGTPAGASMASN